MNIELKIKQIFSKLESIYSIVSKPKIIYKSLRCEITEDKDGNPFSVRWTDCHYQYNDTIREKQAHKYEYEVTSKGMSLYSYVEYDYENKDKWNRCNYKRYWSIESPEDSTMRLIDIPRGHMPKHIEIIRKYLAELPAWSWAVAC